MPQGVSWAAEISVCKLIKVEIEGVDQPAQTHPHTHIRDPD